MEREAFVRTLLAVAVGAFILLLVLITLPRTVYHPQGILLPAEKTRVVTNSEITFFDNDNFAYQNLGSIRVSSHYTEKNALQAEKDILRKVKELALQVGANGVIVKYFAHTDPARVPSGLGVYSFGGNAIYKESK